MPKAKAKRNKKPTNQPAVRGRHPTAPSPVDEAIAQGPRNAVLQIVSQGKTAAQALEVALSAIIWGEHLVGLFESENRLPRPLACQPGCDSCCFNQIEVTPPEALLLGDYVEKNFSADDRAKLRESIQGAVRIRAGKTQKELAQVRQQLPCLFLTAGRCAVYPVRPLVCRAMHALDAVQCQAALKSQDLRPVEHYSHRQVFTRSVIKGLVDGCLALGLQAGSLDLAGALGDCLAQPQPAKRWIQGEKVFGRISPLTWRTE